MTKGGMKRIRKEREYEKLRGNEIKIESEFVSRCTRDR